MRKDVRLGLAVGSLLFIFVLAYVLFFTGGSRPPTERDGGPFVPSAARDATADAGGDAFVEVPYQQTQLSQSPGQRWGPLVDATVEISGGNDLPDTPADLPEPAAATDWMSILYGGAELLRTQTPFESAASGGAASVNDWSSRLAGTEAMANLPGAGRSTGAGSTASAGTYTVKAGETFWSIAREVYGDGSYYPHLVRANPQVDPSRLRAGMTITLPDRGQVAPAAGTSGTAAVGDRPLDPSSEYRVQAGDSLYSISRKLYGRADLMNQLYELNKGVIGPNPAALKLGTVLKLPQPPSVGVATSGVGDIR